MLQAVTLKEIEAIFAVTDAMGISREALVIPLAPGRPAERALPHPLGAPPPRLSPPGARGFESKDRSACACLIADHGSGRHPRARRAEPKGVAS